MTQIDRLSTHVLDTTRGTPAAGIPVSLETFGADGPGSVVGAGATDADGRIGRLNAQPLEPGEYRLTFLLADYFQAVHGVVFYPRIAVHVVLAGREHYHVPVLAGTYSYSTYLGS